MKLGKKNGFYNLKNLLSKNATYNVAFGERSNGKTFAVLEYSIEQWNVDRSQFAYVRRWKEDTIGKRASDLFGGILKENKVSKITHGKYQGVYYWNGKFYMCNYDENGKAVFADDDILGYTFALSETEHNKSISYPNITTIFFDEFLTNHLYLNDEFVLFMNTISTIVRRRTNVKIFMMGNTVNRFCPYFAEMGLTHVQKMKQGDIDIYSYGDSGLTVAVEYAESTQSKKENNYYFAFENPKLQMITGGAWELGLYPHLPVKYKPSDVMYTYFIVFNGQTFQCEIVRVNNNAFTFVHLKTTPIRDNELVYCLDEHYESNYNKNVLKPKNKLQERIKWFYVHDKVFYQDNETGNTIENYLKCCRG